MMPSSRKILVCTAMRTEEQACLAGLEQSSLQNRFEILRTGIGMVRAEKALRARLAPENHGPRPSLVISTGFAGSWDDRLEVGSWSTGRFVADERGTALELEPLPLGLPSMVFCVNEIYHTPPPALLKEASAHQLPASVDMESFALARVAREAGIPFAIYRLISDSLKQPLPKFVGHFTRASVEHESRQNRMMALLAGAHDLIVNPQAVAAFLKNGARWRADMASGWARAAPLISDFVSLRAKIGL